MCHLAHQKESFAKMLLHNTLESFDIKSGSLFHWGQIVFVCVSSSTLTLLSLFWWWKERMWTASTRLWPRSPTLTLASSPRQASDGYTSSQQYSKCTYTWKHFHITSLTVVHCTVQSPSQSTSAEYIYSLIAHLRSVSLLFTTSP